MEQLNPAADARELDAIASFAQRLTTLIVVVVPFAGLIVAVAGFWGWGVTTLDLAVLAVMYALTGMGITLGFHRLFAHRAFETIRPIEILLGILGCMAIQGPLLRWVATHRMHHQHSDQPDDPHSPNAYGTGARAVLAGWWHAHIGWMFLPPISGLTKYIRDFQNDSGIQTVSRLFLVWTLIGLAIPTAFCGWLTGTWTGALLGLLWGGLVRTFFVHHVTWSINSVCHLWGSRPFATNDESRNNGLFGVLALGEGWHNNHHAFPRSARHGLRWWQFDASYLVIVVLRKFRLAWNVRLPASSTLARKDMRRRKSAIDVLAGQTPREGIQPAVDIGVSDPAPTDHENSQPAAPVH